MIARTGKRYDLGRVGWGPLRPLQLIRRDWRIWCMCRDRLRTEEFTQAERDHFEAAMRTIKEKYLG